MVQPDREHGWVGTTLLSGEENRKGRVSVCLCVWEGDGGDLTALIFVSDDDIVFDGCSLCNYCRVHGL